MTQCYAYIRVSTARQEEQSASFTEQQDAISRYAEREHLKIVEWFEEVETAAKRGRGVFAKVVQLLRAGKAEGLIMHKIDRSSRNYFDWGDINELADLGIAIHYAHDNLVLNCRSTRLMADIQAVVATDYIRNLKDEIRKGIHGRLTEGLLPWGAPLGYRNHGKGGKRKTICRVTGPLVRQAFELYATGTYSLETLGDELYRRGLRNRRGRRISMNGLSRLLNNPFYMGLILHRKTGEVYKGIHKPLIKAALFKRVQERLRGKTTQRVKKNIFLYRRLFHCARCTRSLIGERQKGHVYYRCHTRTCPPTCVREEAIEAALLEVYHSIALEETERAVLDQLVTSCLGEHDARREEARAAWQRQLAVVHAQHERLVDLLVDGALDKESFEARKRKLLTEQMELEQNLNEDTVPEKTADRLRLIVELAHTALLSQEMGNDDERRELLQVLTSNRTVDGKNVVVELAIPFSWLAKPPSHSSGARYSERSRSGTNVLSEQLRHVVEDIYDWLARTPTVHLSVPGSIRDRQH